MENLECTCIAMTNAVLVGHDRGAALPAARATGSSRSSPSTAPQGREEWYTPWGGPPATRSFTEWDDDVYRQCACRRDRPHRRPWQDVETHDRHRRRRPSGRDRGGAAAGRVRRRARDQRGPGDDVDHAQRWARRALLESRRRLWRRRARVGINGPRGGQAAVYRGGLGGGSFERCVTGLPAWFDGQHRHVLPRRAERRLVRGVRDGDGRLFGSADAGSTWAELAAGCRRSSTCSSCPTESRPRRPRADPGTAPAPP